MFVEVAAGFEVFIESPELDDKPRDHCGVWGIWDLDNPHILTAAKIGLDNIQHRGEGGAGVAVVSPTNDDIAYVRGRGKVVEVFGQDSAMLHKLLPTDAYAAIAQTHWPTDGGTAEDGTQPRVESLLSLAHNGQITNKVDLAEKYEVNEYTSDTDLVTKIFNKVAMSMGDDVERAITKVLPDLRGAFCFTILTKDKLIAVRDRNGVRPLQLGRTDTGGYVVASENMAIDNVPGAHWMREIAPAEMVVIDKSGLRSGVGKWDETADPALIWAEPDPAACLIEYIYFANKATMLNGVQVGSARRDFGRETARRIPAHIRSAVQAIIPLPNGANQVAHGMEEETGIPFIPYFKLNPDIAYGRAFIQSGEDAQIKKADEKLVVDPAMVELIENQEVIIADDSQVRSVTMRVNIPKVRAAHPKKVHVVIGSPMYTGTCELGVDTPNQSELIAYRLHGDLRAIAAEIGADSITYAQLEDMQRVVGRKICSSCMGGDKPNRLPDIEIDDEL